MRPDTFRLETHLDERGSARLRLGLAAARFPATVDGAFLVFQDAAVGKAVEVWAERLINYNHRLHREAKAAGRPLTRHKPRDDANLILSVCLGLQQGGPRRSCMRSSGVNRSPTPTTGPPQPPS